MTTQPATPAGPVPPAAARVTVVGLDGGQLAAPARAALAGAALVVGGRRHLDLVAGSIPSTARVIELGPLSPALAAIAASAGPAVVLASGDPGWFGVVRALGRVLPHPPAVIPVPSTLSRLAATLGLPWDHIPAYSGHGRNPRTAVNAARALPAVAILTGPGLTARDLAVALDGWPRVLTIGERLGHPDQRITTCPASQAAERDWAVPNLVLVTDPSLAPVERDAGWALPESEYQHRDSMITKAEVRALAVARLAPQTGRLIWDVGAGSGSVGIECAGHGAAVIAIEADPDAAAMITKNAERHRVAVRVVTGRAPAALAGLPEPDAVFVGGGGPEVIAAVVALRVPRVVVTCAALDHALAALRDLRSAGYTVHGCQLAVSRFAELPGGGVRLAALNPVTLLSAVGGMQT